MKVKFWGVRGSIPSSQSPYVTVQEVEKILQGFFKAGYKDSQDIRRYLSGMSISQIAGYGNATTCVEVKTDQGNIIIDGGSGIKNYSDDITKGEGHKSQKEFHIFLTHFHWDHLIGLPFFTPHFFKGYKINYYAVQEDMEQLIKGKFRKPYFPVNFESLQAEINFHVLEPRKPVNINGMKITPYQLDHPDPCWGFKIENEGKVYSHCVDTEGRRVTVKALGPDLPLYQGVDLMYYDAQYTLPELADKINWGHSAAQIGLDLAFRENIKYVLFGHHDPGAGKVEIAALKQQTREYYNWKFETASSNHIVLPNVKWRFAYEGMEIDLEQLVSEKK